MIGLDFKSATAGFFDRDAVLKAVDRATRQVLSKFGALVRKGAQKSLQYDDNPSAAGSPPHAHKSRSRTKTSKKTGKSRTRQVSFLREFLYFGYDATRKSVVIGPVRLGSTVDPSALPALEYGGTSTIVSRGERRRARIQARPFMGPAFDAEKPGLPAMWKDSVR